ncbi:MAG: hypothetical protein QW677_11660, partial [Pyrobaculum sp.]|uniref:hypothetical protein n=1 Tax=Pyrobaculum sp. TaxID=2004705 RepID=UPI0031619588
HVLAVGVSPPPRRGVLFAGADLHSQFQRLSAFRRPLRRFQGHLNGVAGVSKNAPSAARVEERVVNPLPRSDVSSPAKALGLGQPPAC